MMTTKEFTYPRIWMIMRYMWVIVMICMMILWTIGIFQRIYPPIRILPGTTGCDISVYDCVDGTFGMILWFIIGLIVIGCSPTIILRNDGIIVKIMIFHYFLHWSDLHQIRNHRFVLVNWWFVSTTKLPFFFRVYGLGACTLKPTFVIFSRISNHKELISTIQLHLHGSKGK